MNAEIEAIRVEVLEAVRVMLANMEPSERAQFFRDVRESYCSSCGEHWASCGGVCENDE